jgi:cytosine/uracil/thiamine/allantoin permease
MRTTAQSLAAALVLAAFVLSAVPLSAEDFTEKAGIAVGVTVGNLWFVPIKAMTMTVGAMSGALSYVVTGGNRELTEQIWQDTLQGPYMITPELARKSIGHRPEIQEIK